MHVHTDRLTSADLREALHVTGLASRGVYFDYDRPICEHGSRKRARRIDFYLVATDGYGRRWTNSGLAEPYASTAALVAVLAHGRRTVLPE
jgi:hypothetical protein